MALNNMLAGLGSSQAVPNILNTVTNQFDQQRAAQRHTERMAVDNRRLDLAERGMDTEDGRHRYEQDRQAMEMLSTNLENEAIQAGMPTSQYMRQPEVAAKYAPLFAPHLNSVTRRQNGDAYGELLDSTQGLNPTQLEDGSWGIFATRKDGEPGVITQNRTDDPNDPVQSMNDVEFLDQFVTPTLFKTRLDDVIGNSRMMLGERGDVIILDEHDQPDPGRSNQANEVVEQAAQASGAEPAQVAQGYASQREADQPQTDNPPQQTLAPPEANEPAPQSERELMPIAGTPAENNGQFAGLTDQQLQDGFARSLDDQEFYQLQQLNDRVRNGQANPDEHAALVRLVFGEDAVDPGSAPQPDNERELMPIAGQPPAEEAAPMPRAAVAQTVPDEQQGSTASPRNRGRNPVPDLPRGERSETPRRDLVDAVTAPLLSDEARDRRGDEPRTGGGRTSEQPDWRAQLTQEQQTTAPATAPEAQPAAPSFTDKNNMTVSDDTEIPEDVNEAAQDPSRLSQPGRTGGVTNSQIVNGKAVGNPRYSLAQQMSAEALFYKHHTGSVPANLVQRYQQMAAGPDPEKQLKLRSAQLAYEHAVINMERDRLKFTQEWGEAHSGQMTPEERDARRNHREGQWDNIAEAFAEERNRRAQISGMTTNERSPAEMLQHMQEWVVSNGPLLQNLGLVGFEGGNIQWETMTDVGQEYARDMMRTAILHDGVYERPRSWWRPAATSQSVRDDVDFTALPVPTGAPNSDRMRQANVMMNELRRNDPEKFQALAQHYDQKGQYYIAGLHSDIASGSVLPTFDAWIDQHGGE